MQQQSRATHKRGECSRRPAEESHKQQQKGKRHAYIEMKLHNATKPYKNMLFAHTHTLMHRRKFAQRMPQTVTFKLAKCACCYKVTLLCALRDLTNTVQPELASAKGRQPDSAIIAPKIQLCRLEGSLNLSNCHRLYAAFIIQAQIL